MSEPGWYPDPAGRPGHVRYWDGRGWSSSTRPGSSGLPAAKKSRLNWTLGAAVAMVVVIVVIALALPALRPGAADSPAGSDRPPVPARSDQGPAPLSCGERSPDFDPAPTGSAMVRSGRLSYPELTAPFDAPNRTTLLPFDDLRDVASQFAVLRYHGSSTGGAEVMIARAPYADGFTAPRPVAELLFGCVQGHFPGAEEKGHQSRATRVDGHRAWLIRSHLGYGGSVEAGVRSALVVMVVVATANGENGLFYAYLPDTHPELVPRAERALAQLSVS